ncbi:MAG TPA: DUF3365 domain-containing protein [Nitrospirae bacterium]|nr:DUF3365 domain-containing protein [Nitrospirota bacterium]HDY72421.1 DUF3365 domain-containing protein [Nitrospirota bacterium]
MFKNMRLRTRFTVIMLIVYLVSLPVIALGSYFVLKNNAVKEILEEANLMLAAMEGVRGYTGQVLRPALQKLLPGKFVIEGMSATKVAYGVQLRMRKKLPRYSFKEATENPLNLVNKADGFEMKKLNQFRQGTLKTEWRGFKETPDGKYYVIMRPVSVKAACLKCHGNPNTAPPEVVKRYGTKHGYGWKVGEIVTVNSVYVPAEVPIQNAKKALITFTAIYSGIFLFVLFIIDRLIIGNIIRPIENFVSTAEEISRGKMDRDFEVTTNDEMKSLADAFSRMKVSLAKAMDILKER